MADTTDTATFATGLREMASDPRDYVIEDYWDACNQAADALERLAAENAEMRKALSDCATAVGANAPPTCSSEFLCEVPREVMLVVTGLRNDAGRYRWWRSKQRGWSPYMDGTFAYTAGHLGLRGRTFDEAIDAAMAEANGDE